mgnify:CR=1 FL=1
MAARPLPVYTVAMTPLLFPLLAMHAAHATPEEDHARVDTLKLEARSAIGERRYSDALSALSEARAIGVQLYGEGHVDVARIDAALVTVHRGLGDFETALRVYEQVRPILEAAKPTPVELAAYEAALGAMRTTDEPSASVLAGIFHPFYPNGSEIWLLSSETLCVGQPPPATP